MFYTFHAPQGQIIDLAREDALDAIEVLPEGVSLAALVFPAIWLIWQRLWIELGFYLVAMMAISLLLPTSHALAALALSGLPGLYLWLEGHNLRRAKLERNGYRLVDVVEATSRETAFARFAARQANKREDMLNDMRAMGLPA